MNAPTFDALLPGGAAAAAELTPQAAAFDVAGEALSTQAQPSRRRLNNRRSSFTVTFLNGELGKEKAYALTVGFFTDARIGEIFIKGALLKNRVEVKVGSTLEEHLDNESVLASYLLQFGMSCAELARSLALGSVTRQALRIAAAIETQGFDVALEGVAAIVGEEKTAATEGAP